MMLSACDGEKEYLIENFRLRNNYINDDERNIYLQLNLKEKTGNLFI